MPIIDNFYDIVDSPFVAAYVVWYRDGGNVYAAYHTAEGVSIAILDAFSPLGLDTAGRSFFAPEGSLLGQAIRVSKEFNDIEVLDYTNGNIDSYSPAGILIPSSPMVLDESIFWFEFEKKTIAPTGSDTYEVKLMESNIALDDVNEVNSIMVSINSVSEYFPNGGGTSEIGADFTQTGALVWIEHRDANDEEIRYERVYLPYDGGTGSQSGEFQGFDPDRGSRSGYPTGSSTSLVMDTVDQDETILREIKEYTDGGHDPETLYTTWGVAPTAADLAPEFESGRIVTVGDGLIREYSAGGSLQTTKTLDSALGDPPVGIHKLRTPIVVEPDD